MKSVQRYAQAEQALGLLRGHWSIEKQLFHVKDDGFRETARCWGIMTAERYCVC